VSGGVHVGVPLSARILRGVGWTLIGSGLVVLLYLVYSLLFTNLETNAAQAQLLERWEEEVGRGADAAPVVDELPGEETPDAADATDDEDGPEAVDPGQAVAAIQFSRPGSDDRPVRDDPLFVVSGVDVNTLKRGPGHYPGTAGPGEEGNFAVAGHRTTYGAPFFSLEELEQGDEIEVTGRDGVVHVYVVTESRVVAPTETDVIGPDPLGTGIPTLTLTTCHPRFSAAQRLIVFGELFVEGEEA
jgi:sortase A